MYILHRQISPSLVLCIPIMHFITNMSCLLGQEVFIEFRNVCFDYIQQKRWFDSRANWYDVIVIIQANSPDSNRSAAIFFFNVILLNVYDWKNIQYWLRERKREKTGSFEIYYVQQTPWKSVMSVMIKPQATEASVAMVIWLTQWSTAIVNLLIFRHFYPSINIII